MTMTVANRVTVFRIALIPLFVILALQVPEDETFRIYAVLCFSIMGALDLLDGFLARRMHEETKLGAILDPIADKILMSIAIVLFALQPEVWGVHARGFRALAVVIVSRDLYLMTGFLILLHVKGKAKVRAHRLGKLAAHFQFLTAVTALLGVYINNDTAILSLYALTALATVASGVYYTVNGMRQLNDHDTTPPTSA